MPSTIIWFRQNLRLRDNAALTEAIKNRGPVIPVFVWSSEEEGAWPPGAASKWWLHHSLKSLASDLGKRGSRLILRRGKTTHCLEKLAAEVKAGAVFWNRRYEPDHLKIEATVNRQLNRSGIKTAGFKAALLWEPEDVLTSTGGPFQVFTAYYRACMRREPPSPPLPLPPKIPSPQQWPESLSLDALKLEPEIDWTAGIREAWNPGEEGAHRRLSAFLEAALADYPERRDRPDLNGVSRLSPHLHFGEISPGQIGHAVESFRQIKGDPSIDRAAETYLRQIVWREFAYHLLFHFPDTTDQPLRTKFERFPWVDNAAMLKAWQKGKTGYPLVDAGMRELWTTGWMHNRVRMIAASFLTKHLLIAWQQGAKWFWDTLVDADLANNTLGWQWVAGCGADAAPYFRIFNPVRQGEKFDPAGAYVRKWVPELAQLPVEWIHKPWEAPQEVLKKAGVALGETYPFPIVDHTFARDRALAAYEKIKQA
jgi:deoxyribodipyrimidine photo-lyase